MVKVCRIGLQKKEHPVTAMKNCGMSKDAIHNRAQVNMKTIEVLSYSRHDNNKEIADVNLTVFQILEALTGELPCHASPDWEVSDKKEDLPEQNNMDMTEDVPEESNRIFLR